MAKFLTAALMVKNEADSIGRAIDSIKAIGAVEDILVLEHGARVVVPEDLDDFFIDTETGRHFNFAAGRNRLHAEAMGEWLLMLDADEELSVDGDAAGLVKFLKQMTPEIDMIALVFRDIQAGRQKMQFPQPRIFRRWRVRWENIVHNAPIGHEPAILFPGLSVLHYGYDLGPEVKERKTARTVGLLKKQLEIDPESHWCHFYLSQIYGDTGEFDKCIEESIAYIEAKDKVRRFNTSVYFTLCQACMVSGNMELSDKWIGESIKALPDDIDIAAIVFDYGIKTKNERVVLSGADMFLRAYDKVKDNPVAMGSRFTYCNQPESLARVLYQIVSMRLEESVRQLERLREVLPTCTDEEKKKTIETELERTLGRLGVRWVHKETAAGPEPEKEAA